MGIVVVVCIAARTRCGPPTTITSAGDFAVCSPMARWLSSAEYHSNEIVRPSIHPRAISASRIASLQVRVVE
jgi:hypothetical protein